MAFSEVELVFLAFIFIFALGFLMLGRNNNTSANSKERQRDMRGQRLSKQVRSVQM